MSIDRPLCESARERIVMVKRILNRFMYPPALQEAVKTVLAQAELLRADWTRMSGEATR